MARSLELVNGLNGLKHIAAMVVYQATLASGNIFYKIAVADDMKISVLIAYRFLFAAILIDVLALIVEWKRRPELTWIVLGHSVICGLLACGMTHNLYAEAIKLTSTTFASAMINLVPAVTFILAVVFRLEKLGLGTLAGKAKVVGTITCISGAMVLTFYKGPEFNIWHKTFNLLHKDQLQGHLPEYTNIGLGAFLAICSCFSLAMSLIVQAKILSNYPCTYSSTALITTMGAIQTIIFALCMEHEDWSHWKLGWNVRLLASAYQGIVASGGAFIIAAWCIRIKGPLYVSIFNPLMLVLVAIFTSLLLGEKLHLGSVIGAVVIITGLYFVLWGKGKELKIRKSESDNNNSSKI